jgi:hypothetical protein
LNAIVWAALGAALGWILTVMAADKAFMTKVESIGSGMFGAVIGAQLQVTLVTTAAVVPVDTGFHAVTLIGALGGGVAMLLLLGLFRKAVGPMKPTRKKQRPAR